MNLSLSEVYLFFFPTFVVLGFLASRLLKRNDIADTFWGLGFLAVSLLSFEKYHIRGVLVLSLVALWSLRLSFYLFFRNVGKPEDIRYVHMKKGWKNEPLDAFLRVFVLQGALLVIVSLTLPMAIRNYQEIGPFDFIGLSLFIIGLLFEITADIQLTEFKKDPQNKGKVLSTGVWALTRHPNYFGESLIWWGVFFFALSSLQSSWTIISPILMTFLLVKVSGVSMLEKVLKKKGEAFEEYVKTTPSFVPFKKEGLICFFKVLASVLVLDMIWLGNLFNQFYVTQAKSVARIIESNGKLGFDTLYWAAGLVYFFIPLGISYFACSGAKSRSMAFFRGALLGLVMYTIYEFTNLALIKNWPLEMALIDILWGPILCGLSAMVGFKKVINKSRP